MKCPKCDGPMWDNRESKRNPKAPDFKCKDRDNCDGAIWLDSKKSNGGNAGGRPSRPASNGNGASSRDSAKDTYWQDKEAREAAKDPVIVAQHSQDMALKYFRYAGEPPKSLNDLAAMIDWFFRNAMKYEGAGKPSKPAPTRQEPEPDPEWEPHGAAESDESGLDL